MILVYVLNSDSMFFEKISACTVKLTTVTQKVMVKCHQAIPDILRNGAIFILWTILKVHQHVHLDIQSLYNISYIVSIYMCVCVCIYI